MSGRRRGSGPGARRAVLPAVLALLALLLLAPAASAHATLERSDPPNGGMVATGRTSLTLWFGEDIAPAASSISLEGAQGRVPVTVTVEPGDRVVHVATPPLTRGTYTVTWAVVAADGHPTRGTLVFGSGFRPDGLPEADSPLPPVTPVLLRALDLAGTLVALGALLAVRRVVPALGALAGPTRRRVVRAGALGATLALVAALATPLVTTTTQTGAAVGSGEWVAALGDVLLDSTWGRLWLLRLALLALAYAALWRGRLGLAGAGLVLAVALDGWAGHASALPSGVLVAWVAATLHVLAAGAWAGALLVLAVTLRPLARVDGPDRGPLVLDAWRAFSPAAAVSSLVLLATGLYEAGVHVATWPALLRGVYGPAVLGKVLVVAVALALAAWNTVLVNPPVAHRVGRLLGLGRSWRPSTRRLRTTVLVEALVLVLAVGLAALMTAVPTAREVTAARSADAPQSARADGVFVTVDAVPTGDRLRLVVRAQPVVRPVGAPVTGVDVAVSDGVVTAPTSAGTDRVALSRTEPGRWEATVADPGTRDWTVEVLLHRAGARTTVVLVPWSSAPERSGLGTAATSASLVLLAVLATALGWARLRRRRADPPEPTGPAPAVVPVLEEVGRR
ncbi:copper resistance CopC family protein [Arthrobacter sp. NEB 688]|uniref:copper resistance CopC/CopD family protein n=1 Tax=Arthrobacter sp. NEB 688 TaxID=904039 RepID=UPI00156544E7|nr:copper resistance CopC family protein [Arthrobacter sp. NEB 688]QKE83927.1 copper resistance protein CopC [Arthrobacter sp. NEB 688]